MLTLVEVAQHLKIPVTTARKLVVAKTLRGFKIGNRWRVLETELAAYIANQIVRSQQDAKQQRQSLRALPGWKKFQ